MILSRGYCQGGIVTGILSRGYCQGGIVKGGLVQEDIGWGY